MGMAICGVGFCQTAQTGINTTTPQQTLHVSGTTSSTPVADGTIGKYLVTPTMRVEGLGKTNNPTPYSSLPAATTLTLPLYATTDGELVIGNNRINKILQTLPVTTPTSGNGGVDNATAQINNISAVYPNVTSTASPIKTQTFTLTQTSMVYISVSVGIGSISNTAWDERARMNGIKLQFSAVGTGSGIPVNVPFASSTDSFTSKTGTQIPTGNFWYNVSKELKLPPGTYTLQIYGIGTATSSAGSGTFSYQVGHASNDSINIIAIAL